jgi:hypothetical protein
MPRLIHLNGVSGIGKSTIRAMYADDHEGALNLDVDILRTMVGGWRDDFETAGSLIRPVALAAISAYLASGNDVVLPQLLVDPDEISKFEEAATSGGGEFVELVLTGDLNSCLRRFHERGSRDPWTESASRLVEERGGNDLLREYHHALDATIGLRPNYQTIDAFAGDAQRTYASVVASIEGT